MGCLTGEIGKAHFWRCMFAEFLATLLFCFLQNTLAIDVNRLTNEDNVTSYLWKDHVYVFTVAVGCGLSGAMLTFLSPREAFMNPSIAIGQFSSWKISLLKACLFIVMQLCGGIFGALLTKAMHIDARDMAFPWVQESVWRGYMVEGVLSFILVLVVLRVHAANNNHSNLAYGCLLIALHMVGVKSTGLGLNPARVFGVAIVQNNWPMHIWIYWAGPFTGGILGGIVAGVSSTANQPEDEDSTEDKYVIHQEEYCHGYNAVRGGKHNAGFFGNLRTDYVVQMKTQL